MSIKKRFKVKQKQKVKRRRRLRRLREKNLDIKEYFCDGRYIGPKPVR